ncbi:unnamed protein product [Hymenolepis diminuta]|uniref:Uncharacterized protein n=1 Tax=Hymenolepis diminuta TaxID=6216 RepID=A0A564XYI1_HYMDI|nr:unnamed protein product [Hymenolepis diminuta]
MKTIEINWSRAKNSIVNALIHSEYPNLSEECMKALETVQIQMPMWRLFKPLLFGPPWIDSVVNEGRTYVFQQDSVLFYKALKTQDWMGENFHHHVIPNL